jgi:translocation and assembly module TamB
LRRALATIGAGLGLTLVFVGATATGAALHLNTPTTRRLAQKITNDALSSAFLGKIVIDEIDYVSLLHGADVRGGSVLDPNGQTVIRATDIRVRVSAIAIAKNFIFGDELHIGIPFIRIDNAEALLEQKDGELTLVKTFEPTPPKEPQKPKEPSAPGRPLFLTIERFELGHAWAHGEVAPGQRLDADASRVSGSLHVTPDEVALDVDQVGLAERRILPVTASGVADFHLRAGKVVKLWSDFAGQIGEIETHARFLMDGDRLEATADIPHGAPSAISKLVPGYPVVYPVTVKASAMGTLPEIEIAATAVVENDAVAPPTVGITGDISLGDQVRIEAAVDARDIDLRALGPGMPEAIVSAQASAKMEIGESVRIVASAQTQPTVIEGQDIPAVDAHAVVDGDLVTGSVHVHEAGMPLDGWFDVLPDGMVRFQVSTEVASLRAVPRIAAPVDGSGRLAIRGTVKEGELDARVRASFAGVRAPGDVSLAGAHIDGRVHGPFAKLNVNASVSGTDLEAGGYAFDKLLVSASGPVTSPWVRATLTNSDRLIDVSGAIDAEGGGARRVKVHIEQDNKTLDGTVARVGARAGGVAIDGIAITGDGIDGIEGSLALRGGEIVGKLKGDGIDVARVVKLAALPIRAQGLLAFDVDLEKTRKGRKGHVNIALEDGEAAIVSGVSTMMALRFDDEKVRADGYVRLVSKPIPGERPADRCDGTIASVRVHDGEGEIKGQITDPKTWERASGSIGIAADDWDLRCIARLAPGVLPLSEIAGKVTTRLRVERKLGERLASVRDLLVKTRGLTVAGPESPETEKPTWESRSIDVEVTGGYDSETGKTEAKLALFDPKPVVTVSTAIQVDVPALLDRPAAREASLRSAPMMVHVAIPRRTIGSFASLPFVKDSLPPIAGEIQMDAFVNGTMTEPRVASRILGWGIAHQDAVAATPEASDFRVPVDVDALATYDSKRATLEAHVLKNGRELMRADAELNAKLADLLAGKSSNPKVPLWTGSLEAKLYEVPLAEVPMLAASNVGGHIAGTIAVRGLGDKPSVAIDLELPDLQMGNDNFFEGGRISLHIDSDKEGADIPEELKKRISAKDTAVAKVELTGQDGGKLSVSAFAGVVWKDKLIPMPDNDSAADFFLSARRFRLTALQPAVAAVLSKLDGYLDGDLRFGWNRIGETEKGKIEADLSLTKGVFYVPQLGQEFTGAHLHVIAKETGEIRVDDIGASALSGKVKGWARARFDGVTFKDAAAELTIKKGEELPVALEGVPLGRMYGTIAATVTNRKDALVAAIRIPSIHLELPASIGRNVQSLGEHEEIILSHPVAEPEEKTRGGDARKVIITLDVGEAAVDGSMVSLAIRTSKANPPRVEITDKARVYGDVELVRGQLDVLGKEFELEKALVHLRGQDEPNPYLNATVRWDAPDGSRVYIDYIGSLNPITDEKIHFRSEPARSKQEIIGMLLLGSDYEHGTIAGGSAGQSNEPTRSTGNAAGGIAAGFIADQFSGLLADSGISTSVGTTDDGALKTGLVYEKGTTKTQVTYEGSSGSGPGSTGGANRRTGRTEVSVDWRFRRNWLLRGMVGVGGDQPSSGVDLLWQYRY